jgi:hypothetical protein
MPKGMPFPMPKEKGAKGGKKGKKKKGAPKPPKPMPGYL